MSTLYFTDDHEWIRVDGNVATVGITDYAQSQLGDLVFVQLPDVGATVAKGDAAVVVESVKAASDVYVPVSGTITEINDAAAADPSLVNTAPESDGWLWRMTLADPSAVNGLMDAAAYAKHIA
jgi:glycine cleavage system H protein